MTLRAAEIWKHLKSGQAPSDLEFPQHDGRVDLRGFVIQEPRAKLGVPTAQVDGVRGVKLDGLVEVRGAKWKGIDFSGANLPSLRIFDSTIEDCVFDKAQCSGWRLWNTTLTDVSFREASLRNANLGGGNKTSLANHYRRVDFSRADLRGTTHFAAEMSDSTFVDTNLKKVDFQGTRFADCRFAGKLEEVLFYPRAFRGDEFPPNRMACVDFSLATFHDVEFRKLDMAEVIWPRGDAHIVLDDYVLTLDRLIDALGRRDDPSAKNLSDALTFARKWAGPHQQRGILSKADLIATGGSEAVALVESLLHQFD